VARKTKCRTNGCNKPEAVRWYQRCRSCAAAFQDGVAQGRKDGQDKVFARLRGVLERDIPWLELDKLAGG